MRYQSNYTAAARNYSPFIPFIQKYGRALLFAIVIAIHAVILFAVHFSTPSTAVPEEQYEVLKLVDVEEYLPPPPPPVPQERIQQVINQAKAAEQIVETDKVVQEIVEDEPVYLPQHKISAIPEIPTGDILAKIVYPPMALKQGIQGVVYLELYIDEKGNIRKTVVLKDPGYGFAEAAVEALQGVRCKPALANGKTVAVRFRYPVRFTVK